MKLGILVPGLLVLSLLPVVPGAAQTPAPAPEGVSDAKAVPADLSEANALVRNGDYAGADALLIELLQQHPDDPALLLMHGELLLALGRPADAVAPLLRVTELDPQRERANFQLGSALVAGGQRAAALEAFAREIEISTDDGIKAMAHLNRSMLLQQSRKWADAASEVEAVLGADPSRVEAYGDLVTLYLQAGDSKKAADALARGEAAGYVSAEHAYSIGARLYADDDLRDAERLLRHALELDGDMAKAERSLAACLDKAGRSAEALEHLRRYMELAPDAPDAEHVRARLAAAGKP